MEILQFIVDNWLKLAIAFFVLTACLEQLAESIVRIIKLFKENR